MDHIEAVTQADVRRALDRYPAAASQVITAFGPLDTAALGLEA
jgi:hypothetical protein